MVYDFLSKYFKTDPLGRNKKFEEYLEREKNVQAGNLQKKESNYTKN